MASFKVTGGCLCGGVKYEYTEKPVHMLNCHCTMCRRLMGASYGSFVGIKSKSLKMLSDSTLKIYESSEAVQRCFCGTCGGNIMDKIKSDPDMVWLAAGGISGDPGIALQGHIFTNYKAPWITLNDGLPASGEAELFTQLTNKNLG